MINDQEPLSKGIKWTDYETALVISHNKRFGVSNIQRLQDRLPNRSVDSIVCELKRCNNLMTTGVMEFSGKAKHRNSRPGRRNVYYRIIEDLFL